MKSFMKIVTDILRYTINIVYSFLIFIMMICVLTIIFLIFILDGISHYFLKKNINNVEYQLIEEFNRYVKENRQI
jgi:hypothetical protein